MRHFLLILVFLFLSLLTNAQVNVSVNLNVKHSVDSVSTFERSKFITIHSEQTENEWTRDNVSPDLLDEFLNGYDVYLGRNTGGVSWNLNQVQQDPTRPGYADPAEVASRGLSSRNNYANNTKLHAYDGRKNLIIGGQLHPFWTGEGQKPTGKGWFLANGNAAGEYMGRYIKEFYGNNGPSMPAFVEVINEPAYESHGGFYNYTNSLEEIADFHIEVAEGIRSQLPDIKIGGYTTAFPNFELGDFQRWNNRWKLFMDRAGDKMDFWSIHLYDFPSINNGKIRLRSGSNIEATFDMMEHYSQLSFDKVKPFVISEFGAQMHDYARQQWSPYRDWLHIKACNSQLMSFMERPHLIDIAVNFLIVKAEWGYWDGIPYNHRLMRRENEPQSYTGKWVYTDMIKFYDLWKNVKGTRVDSYSDDLDIQVDAYVDGAKTYVILNNLNFTSTTINLQLSDSHDVPVSNILKRHLTLSGNKPVLEEETFTDAIQSVELGAESTIILEYTLADEITIDETSKEVKYYAETYLQPIAANQAQVFNINSVQKGTHGEGILRLGIGREHGKSLRPTVKVNDTEICVPNDWRGYDQADRERFFGVLEIPVPYDLLQENNTITVQFEDNGGHISSVALQAFEFSKELDRPDLCSVVPVKAINPGFDLRLYPNPAVDVLNFSLPELVDRAELSIYDINGRSMLKETLAGQEGMVGITTLSPGVYMVSLRTDDWVYSQKLIVN